MILMNSSIFGQVYYLKILHFAIKFKARIKSYHAHEKAGLTIYQKIYFADLK